MRSTMLDLIVEKQRNKGKVKPTTNNVMVEEVEDGEEEVVEQPTLKRGRKKK